MKYDLFISYSRKDFDEVNKILNMLKKQIPSLTYWFDINGVESGDEFEDKIIAAIDNSSYVLFFLSDNSIESKWTRDEIMYARNTKKKVIPILLKDAKLEGWFLFKFGRIDCIDSQKPIQIDKLCRNLSDWTKKATIGNDSESGEKIIEEPGGEEDKNNTNFINGHEAVDLGLPSGLKWATCNVGADSPEEYGGYYAWGETEEKSDYSWATYKWCKGSSRSMTKYCTNSSYGTVDNKKTLDPSDDVAHVKWGGSWRMPTYKEFQELLDNCTWEWTTQGGKKGYKVTSKKNGNSIFLPAAGCRYGTSLDYEGSYGYYWSATLFEGNPIYAYSLGFYSGDHGTDWNTRLYGRSVRPVCN